MQEIIEKNKIFLWSPKITIPTLFDEIFGSMIEVGRCRTNNNLGKTRGTLAIY